jgi:hypothetical protein
MTNEERLNDFWQKQTEKKYQVELKLRQGLFNHPNRTSQMVPSGALTLERDERVMAGTPSENAEADVTTLSVTFGSIPATTRHFFDVPMTREATVFDETPAGKFSMMHGPVHPWLFAFFVNTPAETSPTIGTNTVKRYKYQSGSWNLIATTSNDVVGDSFFEVLFGGGYYVPSPGNFYNGGFSEDSDDYKAEIVCDISMSGYTIFPPSLAVTTKRWPWDDAWGAVSDGLATSFADDLASRNASNPGQWSGSLSLAYNFS